MPEPQPEAVASSGSLALPPQRVRARERDTVLQSLRAGVVPRVGQHLIQVGRATEIEALIADIDRIADGGSALRFVIGEYGAGKSFFLSLIRAVALQRKLVSAHADLSPDRRLHSTSGHARSLYAEMMHNVSTRARPTGAAMPAVVEGFITESLTRARQDSTDPEDVIRERLTSLEELTGGYDFAKVVAAYWRGHNTGDDALQSAAVRWLRGEFDTRTDARAALGVRSIIDDAGVYDHLKLFAKFVTLCGYKGLLILIDEIVNLYKLPNTRSRNANYEQMLRIINDCLQGSAEGIGFLFAGTPETLMDTRRGMFSYPALQSRLAQNPFAGGEYVDRSGPVLNLASLSPQEMLVLLSKLRHVFASGDPDAYLVPDEALLAFKDHCNAAVGSAYYRTPRKTIREFVNFLSVLEQNPAARWQDLLPAVAIAADADPAADAATHDGPDELVDLRLS